MVVSNKHSERYSVTKISLFCTMVLSQPLIQALETAIRAIDAGDFRIQSIVPVHGGDINRAFRLETMRRRYFVKTNEAPAALTMFLGESDGLERILKATAPAHAPRPFMAGHAAGEAFLLMTWIEAGDKQQPGAQEALGRLLATLHQNRAHRFGFKHDNYIGTLAQSNATAADWTAFFIEQRLKKQLALARHRLEGTGLLARFDQLFARLADLYPEERPSLVHGDLWSGNYLVDTACQPVLIDPAIYYGHREVDIAMTRLFGGFSERFYAAYHEVLPLETGWEHRVALWNLYPLLVHLNLFGEAYIPPLTQALSNYLQ